MGHSTFIDAKDRNSIDIGAYVQTDTNVDDC